ncbi:MAG: glycosyl hydrolase 115 family protein [Oscillospiraceae bacterium]|nr:glycosyl hydrolase 115 family protein [Oscillospiraceae bacterium]
MEKFVIYGGSKAVPIILDEAAPAELRRAAGDLRQDIAMVTGALSFTDISRTFIDNSEMQAERLSRADKNKTPGLKSSGSGIVVGTIGSEIIRSYMNSGKLSEAEAIEGRWEAFVIKQVGESLVIAGSDVRGTIYGIYALSEEIGVSPWYWFSDVGVKVRERIAVDYRTALTDKGPDVKYRGIFINDEERLIDWAKEKFPTENGTPDVNLYRRIFELLLRLRANTLWPAMHEGTTAFNVAKDENGIPVNAKEAAKYGIIMASSHCEMMLRCNVGEWGDFCERHKSDYDWRDGCSFDYTQNKEAILGYWKERLETNKGFESILALGIRGIHDGDAETKDLSAYGGSKVNMMADVIREQRKLIREVYGSETAAAQVFIPYKGMADIYNAGLAAEIPDDVILMWAEDNYGNLRQTPTEAERKRSGGCGIYYHSSYWSWFSPKSYLWLNSTQIFYMSHQLRRAIDCGMRSYWILNVGDIKPGDIVTELFLKTAWDAAKYDCDYIEEYLKEHAKRDFYADDMAAEKIAGLAAEFYHLGGIKKAEFFGHENPSDVNNPYFSEEMLFPFSVKSENDEGSRLVEKCNAMVSAAGEIYDKLDGEGRDAFYQQLYYHIISYRDVAEEYVYLWKNNLAARQGRYNSAKRYMELSKAARDRIPAEQRRFWSLNGDKWTKVINYDHPVTYYNMNEGVLLVHDDRYKIPEPTGGLGVDSAEVLRFDSKAGNTEYIDVFAKGIKKESWRIAAPDWIVLSKAEGETDSEERIAVSVDWSGLTASAEGEITVGTARIPVKAAVNNTEFDGPSHIEANGAVVIAAERFSESIRGEGDEWILVNNAGRRGGAMTAVPFDAKPSENVGSNARLRYHVYFSSAGSFKGALYRIPTLNEGKNDDGSPRFCRMAIGLDGKKPQLLCGNAATSGSWKTNIMRMTEPLEFTLKVDSPGWHDIFVYRLDPGMIFDRIVIETESGAIPKSLLGPEESPNNIE